MSLLVAGVFGDEVEVFSTDDEGSVHFGGDDFAGEDAATDRYHAGEGAFLICVVGRRISTLCPSWPYSCALLGTRKVVF
jgi:hypothetical protein